MEDIVTPMEDIVAPMGQVDYPLAEWRPSPNFWNGYDKRDFIVVHATASGDNSTEYVPNFDAATGKSVHYAVAMDGKVVQYVAEKNSAWGNCCADGDSSFVTTSQYNWNWSTISIENEKHSGDNSKPLTPQQYQSLLALIRDIAKRWNIPLVHGIGGKQRGIVFHHDLMPIEKARCPGTFPYGTFWQDLQQGLPPPHGLKLTDSGCVMNVPKSFQLEAGESGDLCGPWSVVALAYSVPPGQQPSKGNEEIDKYTDDMVDKLFGPTINHINFPGVDPSDMIKIMNHVRDTTRLIHYWTIDGKHIPAALKAGYPCLFSCNEADINAWNKNKNAWEHAYPWHLAAGHVLPVTGLDNMGNWICPDQLNNSYQGYWPPIYKASDIQKSLSWACIIEVVGPDPNNPWLKQIPSDDPTNWPQGFIAQNFGTPIIHHRRQTTDGHQRLKQLSEAIEAHTSAISDVLMANMDTIALPATEDSASNDVPGSGKSLVISGITVRVATQRVAKSTGHGGAMPPVQSAQEDCVDRFTTTELCGEGVDHDIYCMYDACINAMPGPSGESAS